jgi:hypothetical protein
MPNKMYRNVKIAHIFGSSHPTRHCRPAGCELSTENRQRVHFGYVYPRRRSRYSHSPSRCSPYRSSWRARVGRIARTAPRTVRPDRPAGGGWTRFASASSSSAGGWVVSASHTARLIRSSPPRRPSIVLFACCLVRLRAYVRGVITVRAVINSSGWRRVLLRSRDVHTPSARHDIAQSVPTRRHTVVQSVRRHHVARRPSLVSSNRSAARRRLPRFDWVTRAHTRSVGRESVSLSGRPLYPHDVV